VSAKAQGKGGVGIFGFLSGREVKPSFTMRLNTMRESHKIVALKRYKEIVTL
jgi:hypothetical protein